MKRIEEVLSVEAVKAAYQKTGLKPARRVWCSSDEDDDADDGETPRCACAAGVVLAAKLGSSVPFESVGGHDDAARLLGVDEDLLGSFTEGFDGDTYAGEREPGPAVDAYEHGRKVAAAVFGEAAGESTRGTT